MKEQIKPITKFEEGQEEVYILEDKDFLLITAINNLSNEIHKLRFARW